MDTRFGTLGTNGPWPGDEPVSWQIAVTEERNRQTTEIHNLLVPDPAGILLHLQAAEGATETRPHELLHCRGESEEQLFVFRTLEISNAVEPGASKPLSTEAQHFLHFGGIWHGYCKTRDCMRTPFNRMNQNRGSKLRAPFVNGRRNFQVL